MIPNFSGQFARCSWEVVTFWRCLPRVAAGCRGGASDWEEYSASVCRYGTLAAIFRNCRLRAATVTLRGVDLFIMVEATTWALWGGLQVTSARPVP